MDRVRLWFYNPSLFEGVNGYANVVAAKNSMQAARWIPVDKADFVSCGTPDLGSCKPMTNIDGKTVIFAVRVSGSVTVVQARAWIYDHNFVEGPSGPSNMTEARRNIENAGWALVDQVDFVECTGVDRNTCRQLKYFADKFVIFSVR